MKINIKLGGRLKEYLPKAKNGSAEFTLPTGSKVDEAIKQLRISEDIDELLVIVAGENIPPSQRHNTVLEDGQLINVMPPLKGG